MNKIKSILHQLQSASLFSVDGVVANKFLIFEPLNAPNRIVFTVNVSEPEDGYDETWYRFSEKSLQESVAHKNTITLYDDLGNFTAIEMFSTKPLNFNVDWNG